MIKFILNGDYSIVGDYKHVLHCNFAFQTMPTIRQMYQAWRLRHEIASTHNFAKQVQACDLLILHGGDTPTLVNALNCIDGLKEMLDNKTVLAYSAGISALMRYSYNQDHHRIVMGLGLINMQSIVHYTDLKFPQIHSLLLAHPTIPVITIRDDEFYTIEV